MRISRAPHDGVPASAQWVAGDVRVTELAGSQGPSRTQVDSVRFAAAARTHWHRHPVGQVLVITEGTGLVQRRGAAAEIVRTGDIVRIEAGEWHWHGAAPGSAMTHLAIEEIPQDGKPTERAEAVTDAEYGSAGADLAEPAPLSRVTVMDQKLPGPLATQRVEIRRITIARGYAGGLHVHNGPVFGSIETGSVIYQIEGKPETVLTPGDVFYEPGDVRIARFDAGTDGVTFLGYFLLPDGVQAQLIFPEA